MALSVNMWGFHTRTGDQSNGRFATLNIDTDDGADNLLYTVPNIEGLLYAIFAISILNRSPSAAAANINIAIVPANETLGDQHWIEYNNTLVPRGVLERTQLLGNPGDKIYIRWGTPTP